MSLASLKHCATVCHQLYLMFKRSSNNIWLIFAITEEKNATEFLRQRLSRLAYSSHSTRICGLRARRQFLTTKDGRKAAALGSCKSSSWSRGSREPQEHKEQHCIRSSQEPQEQIRETWLPGAAGTSTGAV